MGDVTHLGAALLFQSNEQLESLSQLPPASQEREVLLVQKLTSHCTEGFGAEISDSKA